MENYKLKLQLEELKKQKTLLQPLTDISFKSKEEGEKYIEDNKISLEKLNRINSEIQSLEWELMTPEERARRLEVAKKIRAKTSGN